MYLTMKFNNEFPHDTFRSEIYAAISSVNSLLSCSANSPVSAVGVGVGVGAGCDDSDGTPGCC